jgi:hypothetical protein
VTLAAYLGHEPLTFSDYIDLDTGRTLAAEPGRTYDLAPAGGRPVPDVPAGWFAPLEQQDEDATAEGDAASPEPGSDEDPAGDQEPEDQQDE